MYSENKFLFNENYKYNKRAKKNIFIFLDCTMFRIFFSQHHSKKKRKNLSEDISLKIQMLQNSSSMNFYSNKS